MSTSQNDRAAANLEDVARAAEDKALLFNNDRYYPKPPEVAEFQLRRKVADELASLYSQVCGDIPEAPVFHDRQDRGAISWLMCRLMTSASAGGWDKIPPFNPFTMMAIHLRQVAAALRNCPIEPEAEPAPFSRGAFSVQSPESGTGAQNEGGATPAPRFHVDIDKCTLTVDGKKLFNLKNRKVAHWMKVLCDHHGQWCKPSYFDGTILAGKKKLAELKDDLPEELQGFVDCTPNLGTKFHYGNSKK